MFDSRYFCTEQHGGLCSYRFSLRKDYYPSDGFVDAVGRTWDSRFKAFSKGDIPIGSQVSIIAESLPAPAKPFFETEAVEFFVYEIHDSTSLNEKVKLVARFTNPRNHFESFLHFLIIPIEKVAVLKKGSDTPFDVVVENQFSQAIQNAIASSRANFKFECDGFVNQVTAVAAMTLKNHHPEMPSRFEKLRRKDGKINKKKLTSLIWYELVSAHIQTSTQKQGVVNVFNFKDSFLSQHTQLFQLELDMGLGRMHTFSHFESYLDVKEVAEFVLGAEVKLVN